MRTIESTGGHRLKWNSRRDLREAVADEEAPMDSRMTIASMMGKKAINVVL